MAPKVDELGKPFSYIRDGHKSYWTLPYDTHFRDAEPPNVEHQDLVALACIGHHVVGAHFRYCPSYHVVYQFNVGAPKNHGGDPDLIDDYTVVTNKVTGRIVYLSRAYSELEAVVSWFCREHGHDGLILCHDRGQNQFYIEAPVSDYTVSLDANGTEVRDDEAVTREYRIDMHPNAVMLFGE